MKKSAYITIGGEPMCDYTGCVAGAEQRRKAEAVDPGANVVCEGKGRKQRAVPLTSPVEAVLQTWLRERAGHSHDPLFPTRTGRRLSRDAVALRVSTHAATAVAVRCNIGAAQAVRPAEGRLAAGIQRAGPARRPRRSGRIARLCRAYPGPRAGACGDAAGGARIITHASGVNIWSSASHWRRSIASA